MDAPFRSRNYQALSSASSTSQLCDFDVVIQENIIIIDIIKRGYKAQDRQHTRLVTITSNS